MDAFARWLTRHPLAVVVANLAVTAVLGLYAFHIRIENSLESMLPAGDPKVAYYNATRALFGSDDVGVIGVRADDVFAPSTLEKIARVTDALAKVPGVESVISITNVVDPFANVGLASRLLPRIPPTPDEVEAFKRRLAATPLLGKNLIADDFRGAAITAFFKNLTDAQYLDLGVDRRIMETLAAEAGPEALVYTGAAHVKQAAVDQVLAEQGGGGEPPLERLDLVGRGRNVRKEAAGEPDVGKRVDDVRDAQRALHTGGLRERVGHAGDLLDRRGGEHVVGADADHPHVVAPEERPGGVVVRDLRVARGQHALERVLDPDVDRVEPQHRG